MHLKYFLSLFVMVAVSTSVLAQKAEMKGQSYGDGVHAKHYVDYEKVLKELKKQDTVRTTLKASVSAVCQVKGCWMTVHGKKKKEPEMMVQFKDYGFFMPFDLAGREVIVEGYAYKAVTPVDELRHYAEDAGKSREEIEAITEPKEEIKFLASGVLVPEA